MRPQECLAISYTVCFLACFVLGIMIVAFEDNTELLLSFSSVALLVAVLSVAIARSEKQEDDDDYILDKSSDLFVAIARSNSRRTRWTKFLSRTQNAIKLFMILEALIDIGFGTLILVEPNVTDVETDIANAAIGFASLAIVLTLVSICAFETVYKTDISKKGFFFTTIVDSLFTAGIVFNDISDIFLLSRAVITNTFEEKEMAVFGFMMANAFITEGTVLVTYITDTIVAKRTKGQSNKKDLSKQQREELQNSLNMFRAARKMARFQASITGLLAIPLDLACGSLREILSFDEQIQLALMSLSAVPALVAALVTDKFFPYVIPGMYLQAQEYGPKLLNLAWTAVYLLIEDSFPRLGVGSKNVTFGLYSPM